MYTLARCKFDCGKYVDAANYLYHFRLLSKDEEKCYLAAWGKVAAEVLLYADAETSKSDLQELRDLIDKKVTGVESFCVARLWICFALRLCTTAPFLLMM